MREKVTCEKMCRTLSLSAHEAFHLLILCRHLFEDVQKVIVECILVLSFMFCVINQWYVQNLIVLITTRVFPSTHSP
jgi:hypothetical protein